MKTIQHHISVLKVLSIALLVVATSMTVYAPPAAAEVKAGWAAVGGLIAGRHMARARMRSETAAYNAGASQAAAAPAAAPATASGMTATQKIDQLNKLAAGGYITPAEYKAKKQAILNTL